MGKKSRSALSERQSRAQEGLPLPEKRRCQEQEHQNWSVWSEEEVRESIRQKKQRGGMKKKEEKKQANL